MVQNFTEMPLDPSERSLRFLCFRRTNTQPSDTTLTSWGPCPTCETCNLKKWRSKAAATMEEQQQWSSLPFVESIKTAAMDKKLACWTEGFFTKIAKIRVPTEISRYMVCHTYNILLLRNFTWVLKFKYASYTFNYASFKQTIATVNRTQPMTTQRHPTHLWDSRRVVTQVTATVSHTVHVIEAPFMLM